MDNYYFTCGCGQQCPNGYVKISGTSFQDAREKMFLRYGEKWSFQYNEKEFLPQIEKYNLVEVRS